VCISDSDWDCVYDLTSYHPHDVESMIELLDGRTGHYVFASSTVIYAASSVLPLSNVLRADEAGPPLPLAAVVANAPDSDGQQFRVRAVLRSGE